MPEPLIVTEVIHGYAGRLAYHPSGEWICFDKKDEADPNRASDLWSMTAAGNVRGCLTCAAPAPPFTTRNLGQPAFHPSGDWIVYQAQQEGADGPLYDDWWATPGCGVANDLYVMAADASTTTRVYASEPPLTGAVLHPHFNAAGTKLCWSESVGAGTTSLGHWVLKQAAFAVQLRTPMIFNIQTADPGERPDWLEAHGYDPIDDRYLLFSGNSQGEPALGANIYVYDSVTLTLQQLTDNRRWEEHAHISPNGEWIVFMRGMEDLCPLDRLESELWIMRRDGSLQRQLTYFHDPAHPHFVRETGLVCADSDWHPDGRRLAVFTQAPDSSQGEIRICALNLEAL